MKKWHLVIIITSLLCLMDGYAAIYDNAAFHSSEKNAYTLLQLPSNKVYSIDTSFVFTRSTALSHLSISGKTSLVDNKSVVRVLLIDDKGNEYLVFEDTYLFATDKNHEFSSVAIETMVLDSVVPSMLKLCLYNAQLEIQDVQGITYNNKSGRSKKEMLSEKDSIQRLQEDFFVKRWNEYNVLHKHYWVAGKTSISKLSYSAKKTLFGATKDIYLSDGMEYYVGGFFVIRDYSNEEHEFAPSQHRDPITPNYADNFDWRNRHGKNWMTPVKNQIDPYNNISGNGGCWIFAPVAALESHLNLYYNRLLDSDLSEQEVGSCSSSGSMHTGGYPADAYNYILHNGITDENCFPFQNDGFIPCSDKCDSPNQLVQIFLYRSNISSHTDTLKKELITYGPLVTGYGNGYTNHVMCLCGYGTIMEGSHIEYVPQTSHPNIDTIIPANSNLVGQTYWIYKNSYGLNSGINGYLYAVFENDNTRQYTNPLLYPVTTSVLTTNDIVCEDADHDGYYFWGLGPKPSNCPICCPDMPDGDDSNPLLAEMDEYGNFAPYSFPYSTTTINNDTVWDTNQIQCGDLLITNGATLTLTAELTMNPLAHIIVQNGGKLIVDGGIIIHATIDIHTSSELVLLHGGIVYIKDSENLIIKKGAKARMTNGRVLLE